jgi:signal transduction histidine kinase
MAGFIKNKSVLFYVLVAYILLQFIWWEVLLVKQSRQIFDSKEKLIALGISNPDLLKNELIELQNKRDKYIYMIIGEGTIFLIFISIGILRVYKSHQREKEIAQQQKNFLLSVSHELKTPLATTKLHLQTLIKRELPKETQLQFLETSLHENERLTQLIENILISTRLDDVVNSSGLLVHAEKVNITALINTTIAKSFTSDQQLRIKCLLEENVFLNTDAAVFPSIAINLIENALKYSSDYVEVELKKQNNTVFFLVKDKGTTIPPTEQVKVFDKFYRSGNEEVRKNKGTGLGLFIVKKLVEMHNASIHLKPNLPMGNIFEIRFLV